MLKSQLSRVFAAALAMCAVTAPGLAQAGIFVEVEPPAPRVEVVPDAPYAGAGWRMDRGHWRRR